MSRCQEVSETTNDTMIAPLKGINWNVFALMLVGGLLGVLAVLPYAAEIIENLSIPEARNSSLPFPLVVLLALLQNGILLSAAIVVGMKLSERVGLRMPLIHAWATGTRADDVAAIVTAGALVGVAIGSILVALEAVFFLKHLPASMRSTFEIPLWKRLLAGIIYGGITEELFMRLFLVSLVAWLVGKFWKTSEGTPTPGAFWTAIIVVALLFGLGHLPMTAVIAPLTQTLVVRAVLLNGVAGVAFGYLYWRHGLEAAMAGHMSAHLVMQGPGVMLLRNM